MESSQSRLAEKPLRMGVRERGNDIIFSCCKKNFKLLAKPFLQASAPHNSSFSIFLGEIRGFYGIIATRAFYRIITTRAFPFLTKFKLLNQSTLCKLLSIFYELQFLNGINVTKVFLLTEFELLMESSQLELFYLLTKFDLLMESMQF